MTQRRYGNTLLLTSRHRVLAVKNLPVRSRGEYQSVDTTTSPPNNPGGEVVANQSLTNKTNYRENGILEEKRGSSNAIDAEVRLSRHL
jgi:hypothetical protein